jgi:hypothetical protein
VIASCDGVAMIKSEGFTRVTSKRDADQQLASANGRLKR